MLLGFYVLKYGTDLIPLFLLLYIGLQHRSSLIGIYYIVNLIFIGQCREYCCCCLGLFYWSQIFLKKTVKPVSPFLWRLSQIWPMKWKMLVQPQGEVKNTFSQLCFLRGGWSGCTRVWYTVCLICFFSWEFISTYAIWQHLTQQWNINQ